ncbi:hypothetical protein EJ04DRAFT_498457 [Polyplosphaeria fusca]|uniref:AAA protein C-terminal winged helix domain-containing protein n=1 Tax=Polyplosphaeria fusca TaxID=682080 RepID=A0A9P4QPZ4_9PLEO|nr:hypothetical protein EJ04DRAFT_498457 [Polyplosphaeria fusca]
MPRSLVRPRRGWVSVPLGPHAARSRPPFLYSIVPPYASRDQNEPHDKKSTDSGGRNSFARSIAEGSTVALLSLLGLGLGGYAYSIFYKRTVSQKIENAFSAGYSSNELVALGRVAFGTHPENIQRVLEKEYWVPRQEQPMIDDIINGKSRGRYYLIMGERGTGKRSLLLEGMRRVGGYGIAMLEAHNDLEVFRIRLGKALDYEFHEDYIGSLFSIKGPRDTTPLLDIERALNKMEKVALKLRKKRGRPLLLIINNIHLFKNDAGGQDLLEILQQRAEIWAANELVTTIFTSDEHWTMEDLIPHATNMHVINIRDVPKDVVTTALKNYRMRFHDEDVPQSLLDQVYGKVGGRLIFLNQVAKSKDMLSTCQHINRKEKLWLLNKCWILGESMDDDWEDPQKLCFAGMQLARELVLREKEQDGTNNQYILPEIPLHEARQIITRADFTQDLDHINVIHIDANGMVRADSMAMQNAFREICSEDGFEDHLKATLKRLDELESLRRTREVSFKEQKDYGDGTLPEQTYCAKL